MVRHSRVSLVLPPFRARVVGLALVAVAAIACSPRTDRDRYEPGETGTVSFRNAMQVPVYLAGCSHFDYERLEQEAWVAEGPARVCVWEGFAEPVPPGGVVHEPFEAREPGTWRLRYPVGIGCDPAAPLSASQCRFFGEITSNEFEVAESGCFVSGCSGQICDDRLWVTTCEWRPQYACYRKSRCGRFGPDGRCGWEQTPELLACLADPPDPG